ncbi:hypothetical protein ACFWP7_29565 [Streptomyces sp. NPDC058470]|uniref:hypothetical protein n=1 Tax=Streptomyces sp. NPDC058470 TaxID=3346515 RepID=UPI0036493C59
MSWKRGLLAALAVCALLGGPAGCGSGAAHEPTDGVSASPVGELLEKTDEAGRHYREIEDEGAPEVAIEVQPESDNGWDVRLTFKRFRFSPAGTRSVAVAGRGIVILYLDGRSIATLRTAEYHLPGALVPRGTHQITARLYADDHTLWAVDAEPVESTADITSSQARQTTDVTEAPEPSMSTSGSHARTDTGGSPDPGGEAS